MYSRVYVEITNICNMRCSFCHGHSRAPGQMRREDFLRILERLRGTTQYIYYHLMGEPLTHPELPDFVQLAAGMGFHSVITTNGTLLASRGQALIAARPHKISISLHSFEDADDSGFLRYLAEVAAFAQAAADNGSIVVLRLWNRGFDRGRNDQAVEFLRTRIPGQWSQNSRGIRIRDKLYLEWGDRFQWPDKDAPDLGQEVFCYGLQDHFGILCDGSVVPCCLDSDGIITLGNIFTQEIGQILSSPRVQAIREGFQNRTACESLCRRCGYARRFRK